MQQVECGETRTPAEGRCPPMTLCHACTQQRREKKGGARTEGGCETTSLSLTPLDGYVSETQARLAAAPKIQFVISLLGSPKMLLRG